MNLNSEQLNIHFVGIKGIAMAALAVYCTERGYQVSGSDLEGSYPSDDILKKIHLSPLIGFHKENIKHLKPDLVIYTGAHNGRQNPEVQEAITRGIEVLPHGKALGMFMNNKKQLSVAGCHGKTTTTSMLAIILSEAKTDPSYIIGCGEVRGLGLPGHFGTGEVFIAEADEYVTDPVADRTPRFLWQNPEVLVITNVDFDHPDAYPTLASIKEAYRKFVDKLGQKGTLILNQDDPQSWYLKKKSPRFLTVGEDRKSDYRISDIKIVQKNSSFMLTYLKEHVAIRLNVPGRHNIHNAAMAAVAAREVGIPWNFVQSGLAKFRGAKRRFEYITTINGVRFFDDYAHHPSEIQATLRAARLLFPKQRIIAVFQPHTYSRTKALLDRFAVSFKDADVVILTSIYASAREYETLGMDGKLLAEKVRKYNKQTVFAHDAGSIAQYLDTIIQSNDIVVFMGAGDIYAWEPEILNQLNK